jgi:hypothetical protein
MSNSRGYIIETAQSSSTEYGSGSVDGRISTSQAPFALRPYVARLRRGCVPYLAGSRTALDSGLRQNCFPGPAPEQFINLPVIDSGSDVYNPSISTTVTISLPVINSGSDVFTPSIASAGTDVNFYTDILSESNPNNTTSMHVGSIYLDARTYTTIGALLTDIGSGGSNAHIELKRFTNGTTLMSASNTNTSGPTWRYVTASSVAVSAADWYDIYISASGNPATASIRGIYYEF